MQAHSGVEAQTSTAGQCRPLMGFELLSLRVKTVHFKTVFISSTCTHFHITEDKFRGILLGDQMEVGRRKIIENFWDFQIHGIDPLRGVICDLAQEQN